MILQSQIPEEISWEEQLVDPEPILSGAAGHRLRQMWVDRITAIGLSSNEDVIGLLGGEGNSILVGSGKNPFHSNARLSMPFVEWGNSKGRERASTTFEEDVVGDESRHIIIASGTCWILSIPIIYLKALIAGLNKFAINARRHQDSSCWQAFTVQTLPCTPGILANALNYGAIPPSHVCYHRYGVNEQIHLKAAEPGDLSWFAVNHGVSLDRDRIQKSMLFSSIERIMNQSECSDNHSSFVPFIVGAVFNSKFEF